MGRGLRNWQYVGAESPAVILAGLEQLVTLDPSTKTAGRVKPAAAKSTIQEK